MQTRLKRILAFGLAAVVTLATADAALARKKHRTKVRAEPAPIARDYDGTPIIMQGFSRKRPAPIEGPARDASREVKVPRGSSTYVPRPLPSPGDMQTPSSLTQPTQVYKPPPINTFSDRVTNCIHSYPLNAGIGNNPRDQQSYIRQCAN